MGLNIQMAVKRNVLLVRLNGELDQAASKRLKNRVCDVMNKYCTKYLILNLNELHFMDSTGIGFIIGRYSELKKKKGKIIVCSMNSIIERIFNLSGLKKICTVASNEEEAINYLEVV